MNDRPTLYVAGGHASGFVAHAIKAHADSIGARVIGKLDLSDQPKPRDLERERAEIEARIRSPKRPGNVAAADVNHLPLFIAANEPNLL